MPRSPLFEAILRRRPLPVIEQIVAADPDSVRRKCAEGCQQEEEDSWYPLHEAVVAGSPLDVVRFLANGHPQALMGKDKRGWLPLHLAVQRRRPRRRADRQEALEVVRFLLTRCPEARRELTRGGWDAEEIAARVGNREAVRVLQDSTSWFDVRFGDPPPLRLPVHLAIQGNVRYEVIRLLVRYQSPPPPWRERGSVWFRLGDGRGGRSRGGSSSASSASTSASSSASSGELTSPSGVRHPPQPRRHGRLPRTPPPTFCRTATPRGRNKRGGTGTRRQPSSSRKR